MFPLVESEQPFALPQIAGTEGFFHDISGGAILDRPARIEPLGLAENLRAGDLG